MITTTPRPTKILRELLARKDGSVVVTKGSSYDNPTLSQSALAEWRRRYEGTRIGRQELFGEILQDVEGSLWSLDLLDEHRVDAVDRDDLVRVVVRVDPAIGSGTTGIVVAGIDGDGHAFVLDDCSLSASPERWARAVASAYERWQADRIVAERNQGGQLVETVLRAADATLPLTLVQAAHGKHVRAEPIVAAYERGLVHHVGVVAALEDQLTTWIPGSSSPDRLDALVWALTELKPGATTRAQAPVFATPPPPSRWGVLRPGMIHGA